jgi:hypothetical protein
MHGNIPSGSKYWTWFPVLSETIPVAGSTRILIIAVHYQRVINLLCKARVLLMFPA